MFAVVKLKYPKLTKIIPVDWIQGDNDNPFKPSKEYFMFVSSYLKKVADFKVEYASNFNSSIDSIYKGYVKFCGDHEKYEDFILNNRIVNVPAKQQIEKGYSESELKKLLKARNKKVSLQKQKMAAKSQNELYLKGKSIFSKYFYY